MALLLNAGDTVSRSYSYTQPSPLHPSLPQGTGERTGNLFSCNIEQGTITAEGTLRSAYNRVRSDDFIIMETGEYTINALSESDALRIFIFEYMEDGTFVSRTPTDWANVPYTFSLTGKRKMKFVFSYSDRNITPTMVNSVMLNTGSTALPYESFGVKIPISSANTTTPVYLGEVETTRQIRKLVLTGEENFILKDRPDTASYMYVLRLYHKNTIGVCSHLPYTDSYPRTFPGFRTDASMQLIYICIGPELQEAQPGGNTVEGFRYYLAAQYAAGTPVTVWYVLATPTTAIVNEPLMKIGDYADIVSDISVPVTAGGDTISVDATVQPSGVAINYKGWHNAKCKEYSYNMTIADWESASISQMENHTIQELQGGNWV